MIYWGMRSEFYRVLTIRTIGNFLLLSSLFLIGKTLYKPVAAEMRYLADQVQGKKYVVVAPVRAHDPSKSLVSPTPAPANIEILRPVDPNFSVVIPKIAANSPIIANVDPSNESAYLEALSQGVAHAAGTALPGEPGHIFMFAHSTDYFWNVGTYNAVFYLLYKLDQGDEITIFYKGAPHKYRVITTKIVDPRQVEYLTRTTDREFLTLQTCWPLGTTLKRLLVFAEPI